MRTRALSALVLLVSLLTGLLAIPAVPRLVCDMTGEPIVLPAHVRPAAAPALTQHSCCAAKHSAQTTPQVELAGVPCCHYQQAPLRTQSPALLRMTVLPLAILVRPLRIPVSPSVPTVEFGPALRRAAPRAPPGTRLPARAPPTLS